MAGNDPNVGRLASAVGDFVGSQSEIPAQTDILSQCKISMGGRLLCENGEFLLDHSAESELQKHIQSAEQALVDSSGKSIFPNYPPHRRSVEIDIDLGRGDGIATVLGSDLTHEYVTINGDYRS